MNAPPPYANACRLPEDDEKKAAALHKAALEDLKDDPSALRACYKELRPTNYTELDREVRAAAAATTQTGGTMEDVVKLVQYFRHLPHYAFYNRVRGLFYPGEPPVSTVVEVSRFLPGDEVLVEVEATMYLPVRAT